MLLAMGRELVLNLRKRAVHIAMVGQLSIIRFVRLVILEVRAVFNKR